MDIKLYVMQTFSLFYLKMMKTKKKIKTTVNNFLNYSKKGIKSFSELHIPETVISLDVSGNPILSFEGLQQFPQMNTLKANDTRIRTFKGAQIQNSLFNLSLLNTPLSKEKHLTIMSLVTFGQSLQNVNGKYVLPETRTLAAKIKTKVLPYLERGYLISSVEPDLKVHLPGAQRDIIVDLELDEFLEKEKIISENDKKIQEMKARILLLQKEKREKKIEKVDKKKIIDSFLSPSPKKAKKPTNTNKTNRSQVNEVKEKRSTSNNISTPNRNTKAKPNSNVKKDQNKPQQKSNTSSISKKQADKLQSENKSNEKLANSTEEEEDISTINKDNQNENNEENIFNFSDDEAKEEEELPDMNRKPKNIMPISSQFLDDDQLVDIQNTPEQQQTNEQEVDNDLYNDLLNEDEEKENQNELQQKEDDNEDQYSAKIEFKEKGNDEIFHFPDEEEEEEDSPDVAAMKEDIRTPKKKFDIHRDSQDDDIMIDFADDLSQTKEEEDTLLSDFAGEEDEPLLSDATDEDN